MESKNSNWRRERYRFTDLLKSLGVDEVPDWITESDDGPWDYCITRQSAHDSTLIFTLELMARAAQPLMERTSFHKPNPPKDGQEVRYVVGPIRHSTVFGRVDLPAGRYPGMKERVRIPVRAIRVAS